jgi:hypothetical protein
MPLPIQALPKGLISLLDINYGGAGPPNLSETVAGTFELTELYWLSKRERIIQTGGAVGTATNQFNYNSMTVPGNEAWLVYLYTCSAAVPALLTMQMQAAVQMPTTGGFSSYPIGPPASNTTNALASTLFAYADRIFIAPPGSIMGGITVSIGAATAVTGGAALDFVRFRL